VFDFVGLTMGGRALEDGSEGFRLCFYVVKIPSGHMHSGLVARTRKRVVLKFTILFFLFGDILSRLAER